MRCLINLFWVKKDACAIWESIATLHKKEIYCLAIRVAYIQKCEQKLRMAGK